MTHILKVRASRPLLLCYLSLIAAGWLILIAPALAGAADDVPNSAPVLLLPAKQFWLAVISAVVPLATYYVNFRAPWKSQQVKLLVLLVISTAVGVIYTAVVGDSWAFDAAHLQLVATAVVTALLAHYGYKIGGWNVALGGGRNADEETKAAG